MMMNGWQRQRQSTTTPSFPLCVCFFIHTKIDQWICLRLRKRWIRHCICQCKQKKRAVFILIEIDFDTVLQKDGSSSTHRIWQQFDLTHTCCSSRTTTTQRKGQQLKSSHGTISFSVCREMAHFFAAAPTQTNTCNHVTPVWKVALTVMIFFKVIWWCMVWDSPWPKSLVIFSHCQNIEEEPGKWKKPWPYRGVDDGLKDMFEWFGCQFCTPRYHCTCHGAGNCFYYSMWCNLVRGE